MARKVFAAAEKLPICIPPSRRFKLLSSGKYHRSQFQSSYWGESLNLPFSSFHSLAKIIPMAAPGAGGAVMENSEIPMGDKLILKGLKFYGFHGVKPEERKLGQKFVVDVDAWMDLLPAGLSDRLSDTISYTEIYGIVKEVIEGEPHNLLESVAQRIASTTLTKFPQISAVRVTVGKPHVSVKGPLDCLGVEILRYRSTHISN